MTDSLPPDRAQWLTRWVSLKHPVFETADGSPQPVRGCRFGRVVEVTESGDVKLGIAPPLEPAIVRHWVTPDDVEWWGSCVRLEE